MTTDWTYVETWQIGQWSIVNHTNHSMTCSKFYVIMDTVTCPRTHGHCFVLQK